MNYTRCTSNTTSKLETFVLLPGLKMASKWWHHKNLCFTLFIFYAFVFSLSLSDVDSLSLFFRFYEAKIEDVTSDGQCTVTFTNLGRRVSEVCLVALLKPLGKKKVKTNNVPSSKIENTKAKRQALQEQREYLKRKQQKKANRLKELEEEREKEKMKWQQFTNKVSCLYLLIYPLLIFVLIMFTLCWFTC